MTPGCRACYAHSSNHTPECIARHAEVFGHESSAPQPRESDELENLRWKVAPPELELQEEFSQPVDSDLDPSIAPEDPFHDDLVPECPPPRRQVLLLWVYNLRYNNLWIQKSRWNFTNRNLIVTNLLTSPRWPRQSWEFTIEHVILSTPVFFGKSEFIRCFFVHDFPKLHRWFAKYVLVPKWENGLNKLCLILSCFFGNSEHNICKKISWWKLNYCLGTTWWNMSCGEHFGLNNCCLTQTVFFCVFDAAKILHVIWFSFRHGSPMAFCYWGIMRRALD